MIRFAIVIAWSALGWMADARAEGVPCAPRQAMVDQLMKGKYAELPLFEGTIPGPNEGQAPVTVFANLATGTWTMVVHPNKDSSCIMIGGEKFKPASLKDYVPKGPSF